jgi:hypothetical protein
MFNDKWLIPEKKDHTYLFTYYKGEYAGYAPRPEEEYDMFLLTLKVVAFTQHLDISDFEVVEKTWYTATIQERINCADWWNYEGQKHRLELKEELCESRT